jgi:CubicO group peptidase (beta-lactamase class C family)
VEAITDQPLDAFMKRFVFEPLRMEESSYLWQPTFEANHAAPHDASEKVGTKRKPRSAMAAYSLHTTASDYSRFLQAVLAGTYLQTSTAALWLAPKIPADAAKITRIAWGLGWGLEADKGTFFQWGDNDQGRHKAFAMGSVREQAAIVILTNGYKGMSIVPQLVEDVLPGSHPCFDWLGHERHAGLAQNPL